MTQRTDTYSPELKPCPFCGGPARFVDEEYEPDTRVQVGCTHCHIATCFYDEGVAQHTWNRRALPGIAPPTAVPVDGDAMREKAILQLGRICMMLPVSEAEKCAEIRTALLAQSKAPTPPVSAAVDGDTVKAALAAVADLNPSITQWQCYTILHAAEALARSTPRVDAPVDGPDVPWMELLQSAKKVPQYENVPGCTTGSQLDDILERVEAALAKRGGA